MVIISLMILIIAIALTPKTHNNLNQVVSSTQSQAPSAQGIRLSEFSLAGRMEAHSAQEVNKVGPLSSTYFFSANPINKDTFGGATAQPSAAQVSYLTPFVNSASTSYLAQGATAHMPAGLGGS